MMRVKIYTDEELPGGGHMEDHIATFNDMPEDEVIVHDVLVKVSGRQARKYRQ